MKNYVIIIVIFMIAGLLVFLLPKQDNYMKNGKLYINEIMASNSYTIKDDDNEYSDYIEIYNGYSSTINLKDFMLSDSEFKTDKWVFPDIEIEKGEYLIIYASGKNKCDLINKICHTNFKLSSEGEVVTLTDDSNNILSKVTYGKVSNDISISYIKSQYISTETPTPGKKNVASEIKTAKIKKQTLIFNEYMTSNKRSHYLPNGGYYDWVEIYNTSNKDISLKGLYLTDDEKTLNKFRIPNVTIKGNSYLVIYLTGGIQVDNYVCANFKLSNNDSKLIISNNQDIIDEISIVNLDDNISYGKNKDKWQYFMTPTPGYENNTKGLDKLGGNNGNT